MLGVKGVSESIPDEIDAQGDRNNEQSRIPKQPGSSAKCGLVFVNQIAKRNIWQSNSESDETETRLKKNCRRHQKSCVHDDDTNGNNASEHNSENNEGTDR